MSPQPSKSRFVPALIGASIVLAVIALLIWMIYGFMQEEAKPQRQVAQTVQLIRPPPPPPEQPPPPPPPPEEKIEEPLPQDTPEEAPTDEAPAESLGLDAEGVAGSDGFGLAARPGGKGLIGTGGNVFGWYTTMLKDSILDALSADERIRRGSYQVIVRVWLSKSGDVERIVLAGSSGDRELDQAIEQALVKVARVREAPPLEMPQPVILRIVSRG